MRKSFAGLLVVVVAVSGSAPVWAQAQGALSGVAQSSDRAPLANFRVQVRNANTGDLAGSTTSNQAGQFSFDSLQPGNYVVEIVDATGKVVGLSPSLTVTAGATVTVTVGATAAGALAAARWRRIEPARSRPPRQRGGGRRGQRRRGDRGRRDPRRQGGRLPQDVRDRLADARDQRVGARQPRRPR